MKRNQELLLPYFALGSSCCPSSNTSKLSGSITLSSQVLDEFGDPVPYAHVYHEPSGKGTTTDENGYFSIVVPEFDDLIFSYASVATKIPVASIGSTVTINTALQGDEVTVIGTKPTSKNLKYLGWGILAFIILLAATRSNNTVKVEV